MRLISHRGNIDRIIHERENTKEYIQEAIDQGYDVEIDVWQDMDQLYLGHDGPERVVEFKWLYARNEKLWIHTKNIGAMYWLLPMGLKVFYHQSENHTVIGNAGVIWSHDINEAGPLSVIPLLSESDINSHWTKLHDGIHHYYGVCSDFIKMLREE